MITLSKSGNAIKFTFDENSGYLQNGTIDVPVNSLSLIFDESNMATFRKSASNDIFVSANVGDFGMSKSELEAWYKANMVSSGGGGGGGVTPEEVQGMIDESISGKADTSAVTESISGLTERVAEDEEVTARALVDLDTRKLDASAYTPSDYSAGRGISIDSANTISLNVPISAGTGTNSIREGNSGNIASGNYSHAEGQSTSATSNSSHAEGVSTLASGSYSHAEGQSTSATSNYSHAEGGNTTASGNYSHAEGNGTIASGNSSHAEGQGTLASGSYSHAEGAYTTASGYCSHAEGSGTLASNYYSHAEGANTIASGSCSHSEGNGTMANGVLSHAEGGFTNANNQSEHASGQFNISSSASTEFGDSGNTLFSVGNGTADNARHNAFEIRQNADIYIVSGGTDIKLQDHLGGGGGGESCTVDETTIYDIYGGGNYSNDALNMKVRYVVLDFTGDKTEQQSINVYVQFRDDNYTNYVQQDVYLDYTTSSYTLGDQSQAEYIDITYDPTIEDFKIAVATAYTSTIFVGNISFWYGYIKVPFYTISSGSPCTVIENDVTSAISEARNTALDGLKYASLSSDKDAITFYTQFNRGNSSQFKTALDEIDGSNNTLKPDIYVGLGTSGWTEIDITQNQCSAENLKGTQYRVTYDYSEFNAYNMNLVLSVSWAGNIQNDNLTFDSETQLPSLQSQTFTAATVNWNASTKELVITYPETIDNYGVLVPVNIVRFENYACQFGQTITKLESYGEDKQALKPYVQETRAALGGLSLVKLTQAQYDALAPDYDANTLYIIKD